MKAKKLLSLCEMKANKPWRTRVNQGYKSAIKYFSDRESSRIVSLLIDNGKFELSQSSSTRLSNIEELKDVVNNHIPGYYYIENKSVIIFIAIAKKTIRFDITAKDPKYDDTVDKLCDYIDNL